MDFVVEEDLKAHLTCWYIQKYVKENPQPQYFEHIYQWPHMAPTEKRRRKRLPGDKCCVEAAACFGITGSYTIKDLPGIVKHDFEWIQRQLLSWWRRLWAERWVDGSVLSITRECQLVRTCKREQNNQTKLKPVTSDRNHLVVYPSVTGSKH